MVYRRQRKRAAPRRTARRRRYGRRYRRSYRGRRYRRRTSRYPRRARGPLNPPKRNFATTKLSLNTTDPANPQYWKSFIIATNNEFDSAPSGRQSVNYPFQLCSGGISSTHRIGTRCYLHGFRITFNIETSIPNNTTLWQTGYLHFCLVQMNDTDISNTTPILPEFSTPIGGVSNDTSSVLWTNALIRREDACHGKIKSKSFKLITHRKYYVGPTSTTSNKKISRDIQFYIPIKKFVQFTSEADTYGSRPFRILMYYVPKDNNYAEVRQINVSHIQVCSYFKNVLR